MRKNKCIDQRSRRECYGRDPDATGPRKGQPVRPGTDKPSQTRSVIPDGSEDAGPRRSTRAFVQHPFGRTVHEAYSAWARSCGKHRAQPLLPARREDPDSRKVARAWPPRRNRHGQDPADEPAALLRRLPRWRTTTRASFFDKAGPGSRPTSTSARRVANAEGICPRPEHRRGDHDGVHQANRLGRSTKYASSNAKAFSSGGQATLPLTSRRTLQRRDIPDDGNRYWCVGPKTWNLLMAGDQVVKTGLHRTMRRCPTRGENDRQAWLGLLWVHQLGRPRPRHRRRDARWPITAPRSVPASSRKSRRTSPGRARSRPGIIATSMSLGSCHHRRRGAYEVVVDVTPCVDTMAFRIAQPATAHRPAETVDALLTRPSTTHADVDTSGLCSTEMADFMNTSDVILAVVETDGTPG